MALESITIVLVICMGEFVDDEETHPQIARIATDFAEVTGIALSHFPVYVTLPESDFRRELEVVAGVNRRGGDWDDLAGMEMFYDSRNNRIVRLGNARRAGDLAKNSKEIPGIEELLLVHETSHAWQKEVLSGFLSQPQTSLVSAAMVEGHADWMAGEYATRHGLEKEFRRIREGRRQAKYVVERRNSYFLYEEGYEFWRYLARQHPTIDLSHVLKKLPTERQVVFPAEYVSPIAGPDLNWVSETLEVPKDHNPKLQELGFLAFRKYAGTLAMPDSFKADAIAGYLNGMRCRDSQQQVSVLAFANADTARLCFQYTSMQLLRRAQVREQVSTGTDSKKISIASYRFGGNEPRTTCLIHEDRIVFEFDDDRPESQVVPLKDWMSSTRDRFIAKRGQRSVDPASAPGRRP